MAREAAWEEDAEAGESGASSVLADTRGAGSEGLLSLWKGECRQPGDRAMKPTHASKKPARRVP
jgi:hypothetical protein